MVTTREREFRKINGFSYARAKRIVWQRDNYICHYCGIDMRNYYFIIKKEEIKVKIDELEVAIIEIMVRIYQKLNSY